MKIIHNKERFSIFLNDFEIINHSKENPFIFCGKGLPEYKRTKGFFHVSEKIDEKVPFKHFEILENKENEIKIKFFISECSMVILFKKEEERMKIYFEKTMPCVSRIWINLKSNKDESVYGCGEQFSEFNMKGKKLPLWVSEKGVGRNKKDITSLLADFKDDGGGNWYTTYFPIPIFISSEGYFCNIEHSSYMEFDFTHPEKHEVYIWGVPHSITISKKNSIIEAVKDVITYNSPQPKVPEWVFEGIILGVQGGTDIVEKKVQKAIENEVPVKAVWIQDWVGQRITDFGKQLMWNWEYDNNRYPDLPQTIKKYNEKNIRFLGYINPFIAKESKFYSEAVENGYFVKDLNGKVIDITVTTFPVGLLDLTNEEARKWIISIIKQNMIGIGLSGWMADFGVYLPIETTLKNGESSELFHNKYPAEWAKINWESIKDVSEECFFFMRAGYSQSVKYCPSFWHGDQLVSWSKSDGIPTVINAALSLSMSGVGITHSDIGGYTTLAKNIPEQFHVKRSKELFMRWTEQSAFTPIMRTHEGNWPDENWQFDSDEETIKHFARMGKIHSKLKNYTVEHAENYYNKGIPIIKPVFFQYDYETFKNDKKSYLYGTDLFVSPVIEPAIIKSQVTLPEDNWIHLWTLKEYTGGTYEINAEIGYPPVFFRKESKYFETFKEISEIK